MQRFQFRLERVLRWQERVCRLEEEKLRDSVAAVAETEEKLARLAAHRVAVEQEISSQSSLLPADLAALAEFRRRVVGERQALERECEARLAALAAQREKLLAERRKLQVIEKLKERALHEHTQAADREMEILSHENYVSTWISGRHNGGEARR